MSISHRIEILNVLLKGSKELASEEQDEEKPQKATLVTDFGTVIKRWTAQKPKKKFVNRFLSFVGLFFFPLLKDYDRPQNYLKLLKEDSMILSQLIYTLSGFLGNSGTDNGSQLNAQMCTSLLDVSLALRFHEDPAVRRSVLIAFFHVFVISLPPWKLLEEFQEELREVQAWLTMLLENEVDKEIVVLASSVFSEIRKKVSSVQSAELQ